MKENKKEFAFRDLKRQVLTLALAPGVALDEVALSQQYGLSRTPLREVFQRLAGSGYLALETNRGASVSSMDLATMRSFFQTAPMIYAAIARLATEQANAAQIAQLHKIQMQFRQAVANDSAGDMAVHNHRFHEQLGDMAASPYLTPSLGRLLIDHTRMSQRFYRVSLESSRKRIHDACAQHDAMIAAIEQRQAAVAVQLTLQHWELSRREMDKYVFAESLPLATEDQLAST